MVYNGNNYAVEHSPLFYVCFVAAMITATTLMLGLFLIMVGRTSQATKDTRSATPSVDPTEAVGPSAARRQTPVGTPSHAA